MIPFNLKNEKKQLPKTNTFIKWLPSFTLVLTVFTLVATILIDLGGKDGEGPNHANPRIPKRGRGGNPFTLVNVSLKFFFALYLP